jgi:hypothetical protein
MFPSKVPEIGTFRIDSEERGTDRAFKPGVPMSPVIEVVLFRSKPGVSLTQMKQAVQRSQERVATLPGFVSRSTGHAGDGAYVDVVHWQDMRSAEEAAKVVMTCEQCAELMSLIDLEGAQMHHFEKI